MPAYNEEANLPGMIADVIAIMTPRFDDFEIVVTNDGSKDRTGAVLRELAEHYPELKPVDHEVNKGYGAAVLTGISNATKEIIFFTSWTANSSWRKSTGSPHTLPRPIWWLATGRRAATHQYALLFGHGWSSLVTLLFGYTARDIDCAFKLVRRQAFETVAPSDSLTRRGLQCRVASGLQRAGFRIAEVPVSHLPRRAGAQTGARPE